MREVSGLQGKVTHGAAPAATLRDWRLARDDGSRTWTLTATAVEVNAFYITQAPLSLLLRLANCSWRWNEVALEIVGRKVTATVAGRPEVR